MTWNSPLSAFSGRWRNREEHTPRRINPLREMYLAPRRAAKERCIEKGAASTLPPLKWQERRAIYLAEKVAELAERSAA